MCTRYVSPDTAAIERVWHIGRSTPMKFPRTELFPKYLGPFIRAVTDGAAPPTTELLLGQWWLIADGAHERLPVAKTYNARAEDMLSRWSFRGPWLRGQRCIIPAECFYEPNWESGRHVAWRFGRADGEPWGLAGLWNTRVDPETGELQHSYAMLTQNADAHALMGRMHRPDPKRAPHLQDKRSVVPIARADADVWLRGSETQARALIRLPAVELFEAGPAPS